MRQISSSGQGVDGGGAIAVPVTGTQLTVGLEGVRLAQDSSVLQPTEVGGHKRDRLVDDVVGSTVMKVTVGLTGGALDARSLGDSRLRSPLAAIGKNRS